MESKNGTEEPICKQGMEMQRYKMNLCTQWRRREWDKLRKYHRYMYNIMCKTDSLCELLCNTGVQHSTLRVSQESWAGLEA